MKKILIFRQASLGDFIVSIPALTIIRKKYYNHKIYYLSVRYEKGDPIPGAIYPHKILNNNKLIDDFIYVNKEDFSFKGFPKLIKKLRKYQFDNFFYLNQINHVSKASIIRNLFFFSLCKMKKNSSFNLLRYKENYKEGNLSFHLAKRVDSTIKRKDIHKFINKSYKINKLSQNLTLSKFISKKFFNNFITISHGQRIPAKDWGLKNWKILLKKINNYNSNLRIIIVGAKMEYPRAKILKKIKPKNIINLCGKTNIRELMEIINKSKFHISHDDGTMHVASIFNKKNIAIFADLTTTAYKRTFADQSLWIPDNKNLHVFFPKTSTKKTEPELILKKFKENFKKNSPIVKNLEKRIN